MNKTKIFVLLAAVAAAVFVGINLIGKARQGMKAAPPVVTAVTNPVPSLPQPPPTTTSTPAKPVKKSGGVPSKTGKKGSGQNPETKSALIAAVMVQANLNPAKFQRPGLLKQQVDSLVVPRLRTDVARQLAADGQHMAVAVLKFPSVKDAYFQANYFVQVLEWRMERINGENAVVALFTKTSVQNATAQQYTVYGVTFVKLEKVGGQWLYAGVAQPPVGQSPPTEASTPSSQKAAFIPYLRKWGYKPYEAAA